MQNFRSAVERSDIAAIESLLADVVTFVSPVAHKPYYGKAVTGAILRAVMGVFENFRYVSELSDPLNGEHALVFTATVNGLALTGCDFLHVADDGLIDNFMVMVRPLSAAKALAAAMEQQFEQVKSEAGLK